MRLFHILNSIFVCMLCAPAWSMDIEKRETPLTELRWLPRMTVNKIKPALDATFHLKLDDGVDCTGSFISNRGHFVTALHCISACLRKNNAVDSELAIDEPTAHMVYPKKSSEDESSVKPLYSYKMTVAQDVIDKGIVCPGWVGDRRSQIKVVLTGGKGWLTPKNTLQGFAKKFPGEYKTLLDEGYEHAGDFAVLQAPEFKNSDCLSLSKEGPRGAEALQAISYACVSRETMFAFGRTPLYTKGFRTSGFKQSEMYARLGESGIGFSAELVDRPETFFSSADIEKCGSGTALFDENFSIKGIATRVYKTSTRFEKGSLESIDVAQIWKHLVRFKSQREVAKITSCQRESSVHLRMPASIPPIKRPAVKKTSSKN